MRDFAKARTRSFALASLPTAMWIDSDDEFEGGEHLAEMCRQIPAARAFYFNLPTTTRSTSGGGPSVQS